MSSCAFVRSLKMHNEPINAVAFDSRSGLLASGSDDERVILWEDGQGEFLSFFRWHQNDVTAVAFNPGGGTGASASWDRTVNIYEIPSGRLVRTLEGHAGRLNCVAFLSDGRLMASKGDHTDNTIRLWNSETGTCLAIIFEAASEVWFPGLAFHPWLPLLAAVGSDPGVSKDERDCVIHIFELDLAVLLSQHAKPSVTYTSAKVVLVGDSGVGKTGLGWRLAHGEFKEHSSTHGQQFWLLKQLCKQRRDGAQCEAVLWDLAGQDDYRLIHALFLDDADLALVLFDPTRNDDPLSGVEFWLKQLKVEPSPPSGTPSMLIAARSDRGTPRLTQEELQAFCRQRGIAAYLATSAKLGEGIEELIQKMHVMIAWDAKPATFTTETFKRIKDFILTLKEDSRRMEVILTPEELRQRLEKADSTRKFSDPEMLTAVGHLSNHGYVTLLKTSQGELRILLAPELLNNLAASFVLEARRNKKGLRSLEEQLLLSGGYKFSELEKLSEEEKDILLDSAVVLFLEHNVCFREIDPLNGRAYLVFPELINLKKPLITDDVPIEDGVAYTVSGAVENVYASLVVLMGYTQTFTRTNQWRDHARYEVGTGHVCGFRLEAERAGEQDFVLYFGTTTPARVRTLFQSLFESFLARRNLTVRRYEPVFCPKGHPLNRAVVREQMSSGAEWAFCSRCGERIELPKADQPIQLTKQQAEEVEANRREADQRSRFEQALFRLNNYVTEQNIAVPDCFISYAWGNPDQELWVERILATDLQKAGIMVVLDRWENARIGASITRFVERVAETNRIIVVGTQIYRKKYDNKEPMQSFIVAAEGDLIGKRMIGAEAKKESVLPVLLDGTEESAFPPLLQGRVYADFRNKETYFETALELLLSLYQIPPTHQIVTELRESLKSQKGR
jgi:small GTP-binding protein